MSKNKKDYETVEKETKYWSPSEHSNGDEIEFVDVLRGTYYFLKKANKRAIADLYELMYGVKLRSNDFNQSFYVNKVLDKQFSKWAKKAVRPNGQTVKWKAPYMEHKVGLRKKVRESTDQ